MQKDIRIRIYANLFLFLILFIPSIVFTKAASVHLSDNLNVLKEEKFSLNLTIKDFSEIIAYQIEINYNPNIAKLIDIQEGDLLKNGCIGCTFFMYENSTNYNHITIVSLNMNQSSVSTNGIAATLTFEGINEGSTTINFTESLLVDIADNLFTATSENISIEVSSVNQTLTVYNSSFNASNGWTLFSLPFDPLGIDTTEDLGQAINNANRTCDVIMNFDKSTQTWIDDIIGFDEPSIILTKNKNYSIHCDNNFTFNYQGTTWI